MRRTPLALIAWIILLVGNGQAPAFAQAGPPALVLERVVLVERHGVRSPTKTPQTLSQYSRDPWPAWPVAPGELTPHGADNLRRLGAWLRADYAGRGLLPARGCPGSKAIYGWADGADNRTRESGDALLDGAFPGCGLTANHGPIGVMDPLFDGVASGVCPIDAEAARAAVMERVKGDLDAPSVDYAPAKAALLDVLDPSRVGRPCEGAQGACFLAASNRLVVKGGDLRMEGPLATASTLTESLLLEYAQGLPMDAVGWGRVRSVAGLDKVMALHNIESDLMRRTPYLASHNAAPLARALIDALEGGDAFPDQGGAGGTLVLIAGHDTNLANLAGLLDVRWSLPAQPDDTPPDATLAFEVWRNPVDGARYVKLAIVYQTLEQLRFGAVLDSDHPPGRLPLTITGCGDGPDGSCSLERFHRTVRTAIPAACWPHDAKRADPPKRF